MAKLIVVCGATGQVGGSVARRMLKEGWRVRVITRNKTSDAAKALADAGAELETASYDDIDSLQAVFEGANAVFGVTNMFDYLMELGQEGAAKKEYQQMMNIAAAAGRVEGLEHFVLHTLPAGEKMAGIRVPHMDNKDRAATEIKKSFPELAKKTTFLWIGLFVSNFYTFPMMKPAELPNSYGAHVWIQPCKPDTFMYISGDVEANIGTFVNAILDKPEVSLPAKYAWVYSDAMTMQELLRVWSEVTGRRATYVECSGEDYESLWGVYGKELALQFKAIEAEPDWTVGHEGGVLTAEDLGVAKGGLVGLKASLEKSRDEL